MKKYLKPRMTEERYDRHHTVAFSEGLEEVIAEYMEMFHFTSFGETVRYFIHYYMESHQQKEDTMYKMIDHAVDAALKNHEEANH